MDPGTGRLYTEADMKLMTDAERARLVKLEGAREDVERISRAVGGTSTVPSDARPTARPGSAATASPSTPERARRPRRNEAASGNAPSASHEGDAHTMTTSHALLPGTGWATETRTSVLRHVADLLDGFPGLPAPMVMVAGRSVSISFHAVDGADRDRVAAVDVLLAAVGGTAVTRPDGHYAGSVSDWHGCYLDVYAHAPAVVGAV